MGAYLEVLAISELLSYDKLNFDFVSSFGSRKVCLKWGKNSLLVLGAVFSWIVTGDAQYIERSTM